MGRTAGVSGHLRLVLFESARVLVVISAFGLSLVVAFFFNIFYGLGFEDYQLAAPISLVLFPVSLGLLLAEKNRMSSVIAIALFSIFAVGFVFMVPVTSRSYSVYVSHCQRIFYFTEQDSLGYILFGTGFHIILSSLGCQ